MKFSFSPWYRITFAIQKPLLDVPVFILCIEQLKHREKNMKMKIVDIHADGDAEEEYIDLEVLVDCNLKFYALTDSTYTASKGISGIDYLFHWEMKSAVWNDAGDAATLYELSAWTTVKT